MSIHNIRFYAELEKIIPELLLQRIITTDSSIEEEYPDKMF